MEQLLLVWGSGEDVYHTLLLPIIADVATCGPVELELGFGGVVDSSSAGCDRCTYICEQSCSNSFVVNTTNVHNRHCPTMHCKWQLLTETETRCIVTETCVYETCVLQYVHTTVSGMTKTEENGGLSIMTIWLHEHVYSFSLTLFLGVYLFLRIIFSSDIFLFFFWFLVSFFSWCFMRAYIKRLFTRNFRMLGN